MATFNATRGEVTHSTRHGNTAVPYIVQRVIDLADFTVGAEDIIEALAVPAETVVLLGGAEVTGAMTGTSTDVTVTVQVDSTALTSGLDFDAAVVGAYAVPTTDVPVTAVAANTIDVAFNDFTGTVTGGKLRVFALVLDVSDRPGGLLAPRGG